MRNLFILLAFWLFWGFALGTFILMVPVRQVADYAHRHNWPERQENMAVLLFVAILIVLSFLLARFSSIAMADPGYERSKKAMHIATPVVLSAVALFLFLNPALINADSKRPDKQISTQFTIGPYPEAQKIAALKKEGYTAIISLLHPAVVPFEPKLLNEETEAAQRQGMDVISIPMLPWVSDNQTSIDSLRQIVRHAKGKYYVHCYLGKDRVNVARRIIEQESGISTKLESEIKQRSIDDLKTFERGEIYKLGGDVYLAPMPTKEEYFGYIVATDFRQVVSLSDMSDPEARALARQEAGWLKDFNIVYTVFDVKDNADHTRIQQIADSVRAMQRPLVIHAFRSNQQVAQAFRKAYSAAE
ncbi:MAG: hypothetical protein EOP56_00905 [Sphingobacteriales bacterium]|nr:MAG: hypothetical protein EOP56_00905 [Sphingobacteriales bacterium]